MTGENKDLQQPDGGGELNELRSILVQPGEVSEVLPEAVKRAARGEKLAAATLPVVEANIKQSARKRPELLAEALFPVIGPAIRKAIAEALSKMVQSMNQTLENSFSPKGLKWRLEAWQTGRSFGEVVMLHSLLYRVEEVFLIHKETGLLLQHVSASEDVSKDADMVSAMLTAIQDFVHDSFKSSENATLDSLQVNDLSVWIESGPDAILAAVIRGSAPLTYRETLEEAIEEIHSVHQDELDGFAGDSSVFEKSRPTLQQCLQAELAEKERKKGSLFTPTNVIAGLIGLFVLGLALFYLWDYWRWSGYLAKLGKEPGIVVVESDAGWWQHSVSGLRDPMATDPNSFLSQYGYDGNDVVASWKPYQDLSPEMIEVRARKLLDPPQTVKLRYDNGILTAAGEAPLEWFSRAKKDSLMIAGVNGFAIDGEALEPLRNKINSSVVMFNCGTTDLAAGEEVKLAGIKEDLEKAAELSRLSGGSLSVEVIGSADPTGTAEINSWISRARADKILGQLRERSEKLGSAKLTALGTGASVESACKVTFKVSN